MAELTGPCCAPADQVSCCEPTAKASCCGETHHTPGCGCSAGTAPAGTKVEDVREIVREKYAATATTVATSPTATCCAPAD